MKIVVAEWEHLDTISKFLARQEKAGVPFADKDAVGAVLGQHSDECLLMVTDHVKGGEELYDHPMLGEDMLVGLVFIRNPKGGQPGVPALARDTYLYVAPEYHDEVNLVLVLQDLVMSIVTGSMPYRLLWFTQAREGSEEGDQVLCKALDKADLATGYINDDSGLNGYCADLRVGHYLWSVLKRRKREEE